jgi:hypothetical protein
MSQSRRPSIVVQESNITFHGANYNQKASAFHSYVVRKITGRQIFFTGTSTCSYPSRVVVWPWRTSRPSLATEAGRGVLARLIGVTGSLQASRFASTACSRNAWLKQRQKETGDADHLRSSRPGSSPPPPHRSSVGAPPASAATGTSAPVGGPYCRQRRGRASTDARRASAICSRRDDNTVLQRRVSSSFRSLRATTRQLWLPRAFGSSGGGGARRRWGGRCAEAPTAGSRSRSGSGSGEVEASPALSSRPRGRHCLELQAMLLACARPRVPASRRCRTTGAQIRRSAARDDAQPRRRISLDQGRHVKPEGQRCCGREDDGSTARGGAGGAAADGRCE